jgi:hypothetical protein
MPRLLMYLCTALKLCSFGAKDGAKALTLANRATKLHATFILELGVDQTEITRALSRFDIASRSLQWLHAWQMKNATGYRLRFCTIA